jgi:hypothetical protein
MFLASLSIFLLSVSPALYQKASADQHAENSKVASLEFRGTSYFLRWSEAGQYEFTPAHQEDLNSWQEMVTVWLYPTITDGEHLAAQANSVLSNYKNSNGKILRTNSVPRTPEKPAEYFIAAMLAGSSRGARFLEFAAARFVLVNGKGVGIIYSRRAYGEQAPQELGGWVVQNGQTVEKAAMGFDPSIVIPSLQKPK